MNPPQEMAPQLVNPTVIQNMAQPVAAAQIDTAVVAPTVAPTQVAVNTVDLTHSHAPAPPAAALHWAS